MDDPFAAAELMNLVRAHRLTDMVTTAVRLGIPDAIASGSHDVESIAVATDTHAPTLYRLLRALAAAGVLHERDDQTFELSPAGARLQSDAPGSVRAWVELVDRPYFRDAWRHLEHSVRTGENAFTALHGEDIWSWRNSRPDEEETFNRAMTAQSRGVGEAVADAFDFAGSRLVADIGGGAGSLLAAILRRHDHLRGILFDQPGVATEATVLREPDLAGRSSAVGGSFFEAVPSGADVYVMKAILHDWDDAQSTAILRNIRLAVPPEGSLLVIERVVGPPNEDLEAKLSDLHMLLVPGGRERTRDEWAELFLAGGFLLADVRPLLRTWQLLVGKPVA